MIRGALAMFVSTPAFLIWALFCDYDPPRRYTCWPYRLMAWADRKIGW